MAENYSFRFLNKEGQLVTIVSMQCADDQAAMQTMPQFGPPSWANVEIWSGKRRILKADNAGFVRKMQHTKEYHPDH